MNEENQGDDDLFSEVRDEEKINKKDIPKRIKEIKDDPEFTEEFKALQEYLRLYEWEKVLKDKIKSDEDAMDKALLEKFRSLKESEIKEIVIHDKWIDAIYHSINDELERISHKLAQRIKELAERYETRLPILADDVKELTAKVDEHLQKMGFKW
jgi:type I restriction enzyme M protein